MRYIFKISNLMLAMALIPFVFSCMDDTPPDHNDDTTPQKKETQVVPVSPTTQDVVRIITNDCKYYVLASVTEKGKDITIKKRFNSQMKWPCVLTFDTISLGQLKQGNYSVLLMIIDTNPSVADSVFSKETIALTVSK